MANPLAELFEEACYSASVSFGTEDSTFAEALADRHEVCFGPNGEHEALGLVMTNDAPTVSLFFGALRAGARIVSIPPPPRGRDEPGNYREVVMGAIEEHHLGRVTATKSVASTLEKLGIPSRPHSQLGVGALCGPTGRGFELVQFTSGTTGPPKPILLSESAVSANVAAIIERLQPERGDGAVSWLPLSHDMGLIGMLLTSVLSASPRWAAETFLVLGTPEQFLRRPHSWMEAMSDRGGTFTAAPTFGYEYAANHRSAGRLDLSRVRCAIVGGDIVEGHVLRSFTENYAEDHWRDEAFCPAYGMAEVGLALTLTSPDTPWRTIELDAISFANKEVAAPQGRRTLSFTAAGPALAGYDVRVSGDLDEVGPIEVCGPSVAERPSDRMSLARPDGWLETGDLGFITDDELFACGRSDDYFLVHGRAVYAPAVEAYVADTPGVRRGRAGIVGLPTGGWLVCVEVDRSVGPEDREAFGRAIRVRATRASSGVPSEVLLLRPGVLPLTTSGKLRRHRLVEGWMTGTLESL